MKKNTVKVYRHGDLLLTTTNTKKSNELKKSTDWVVLSWEVTNHHHRMDSNADVLVCEPTQANDYFRGTVKVKEIPAKLTHEEHHTIELPKGEYSAYVQREYQPLDERRVLD